jgi:hypothetical protein
MFAFVASFKCITLHQHISLRTLRFFIRFTGFTDLEWVVTASILKTSVPVITCDTAFFALGFQNTHAHPDHLFPANGIKLNQFNTKYGQMKMVMRRLCSLFSVRKRCTTRWYASVCTCHTVLTYLITCCLVLSSVTHFSFLLITIPIKNQSVYGFARCIQS